MNVPLKVFDFVKELNRVFDYGLIGKTKIIEDTENEQVTETNNTGQLNKTQVTEIINTDQLNKTVIIEDIENKQVKTWSSKEHKRRRTKRAQKHLLSVTGGYVKRNRTGYKSEYGNNFLVSGNKKTCLPDAMYSASAALA